ncbi:MAG: CDP-glycerol glycerophosphotransferase family protein [bacterium]
MAKTKQIWVFGAWLGLRYADNPKYMFEYVNANCPEVRAVWITRKFALVQEIRRLGYECYYAFDPRAIYLYRKANLAFISHAKDWDLVPYFSSKKIKFVQLYHGLPLKMIELDESPQQIGKKDFAKEFALIIATSKETRKVFSSAYRVPESMVKITGYPRTDIMLSGNQKAKGKGLVKGIYVPTFRGQLGQKTEVFERFGFSAAEVDRFLAARGVQLDLHFHPANQPPERVLADLEQAKNIKIINPPDLSRHLSEYDFMISDYSGIYFDYLLLNRPVIFAPFDYNKYVGKDKKLYYKYDEITAGPKAYSWDEVLKFIGQIVQGQDSYAEARKAICERFHHYRDGKSCERVLAEVSRL